MSSQKKAAILCFVAAVLTNPWSIAAVFSPDGTISSTWIKAGIIFFELLLFGLGLLLLLRPGKIAVQRLKFYALTFLLVVGAVEGGLHLIDYLHRKLVPPLPDARLQLSIYRNEPWAADFFREYKKIVRFKLDPLIGWRTKATSGRFINVDQRGVRRTFGAKRDSTAESLFFLGGSTVWGEGARDHFTLASLLAKQLRRENLSVRVTNYGERAYTNQQSLTRLVHLLLRGEVPDYVILYSGANEVIRPYIYGKPGIFQFSEFDEFLIQRDSNSLVRFGLLAAETVQKHSLIYRTVKKLTRRIKKSSGVPGVADAYSTEQLHRLAGEIAGNYLRSVRLLNNLARTYGFQVITVLQPVIFTKPHLSEEERTIDTWTQNAKLKQLYLDTYRQILERQPLHLHDLSGVFTSETRTIFMDFCHISEYGNAEVARAIFEIIKTEWPLKESVPGKQREKTFSSSTTATL